MQTIEINTTQNVVINYELAQLRDRIFAFLIDFIILMLSILLLSALSMILLIDSTTFIYYHYFITLPLFFFYTLAFESLNNGQTIGKRALHIRVVKQNGTEAGLQDYLLRWVFRMIDIYFSLGALAIIMISSSSNKQRLGDILAGTVVIRVKPKTHYALEYIQQIGTASDKEVVYPQVASMSEDEMVLVKNVLDRYAKFSNKAHAEALDETAGIIKERLGIKNAGTNNREFLSTLIKDYVISTR